MPNLYVLIVVAHLNDVRHNGDILAVGSPNVCLQVVQ